MENADRPLMLKLTDVAYELQISEPSVRRLIESGLLEAVNVSAGGVRPRLRVTLAAVQEFAERRRLRR